MTNRNDFKAGLFIVISLILILALIVGIKGIGRLLEPHQTRTARFMLSDNIGGLRVGDEVRIGGLKMGDVRDIDFVMDSSGQAIIIQFSLPRRIELREGARVLVESTVTGSSNLNIASLGTGNLLPPETTLEGGAGGLAAFLAVGTKVAQTIDNTNGLISDIRAKVEPAYQKYANVTDRGSEALTNIRDVFGDTKADIRQTMASLASATTTVKEKIGPILEKFDGGLGKAQTALDKVNSSLDDIKAVAENTRDITGNLRQVLNNNRSRIDQMIASLKTTGDNLQAASSEIRRSPWRLLYKPGAGEQANLNLFDSARAFAEGANDLNDAAAALRDALRNPSVDQAAIEPLIQKLDRSFEKFTQVESKLWATVKE